MTDAEVAQRDALVGRLFEATLGTMDLFTVYLGDRLGLYRALAEAGGATAPELATRTGTQERYVREWLEQQAVTGILDVDDATAGAQARRYRVPRAHAEVLLDERSFNYLAPVARIMSGVLNSLPRVLQAFRVGGGVSWQDYGVDAREGQAAMSRPIFMSLLGAEWLPSIPDVHARLQAEPPARVADIACGAGWSSLAIAQAYPRVYVDGYDLDGASIDLARAHAAEARLMDRVSFHVRDAADPGLSGRYDLVTVFEALHDMARPVEALRAVRNLVAQGGAVIIVDERVAESFTAPGDAIERLMYGFSVLCCLPAGMSEAPSAGTGTVMRPALLRQYAHEAGFSDVVILPIQHDLFRVYRLAP